MRDVREPPARRRGMGDSIVVFATGGKHETWSGIQAGWCPEYLGGSLEASGLGDGWTLAASGSAFTGIPSPSPCGLEAATRFHEMQSQAPSLNAGRRQLL